MGNIQKRDVPDYGTSRLNFVGEYRVILLLLSDGHATVKSDELLTIGVEVLVVDCCLKLRSGNAIADELLLNAVGTIVTQTHVVGIGSGVVVGIASEHITLVGVRLHDVGDSTENVAV